MNWDSTKPAIIKIAKSSASVNEVAQKASKLLKKPVSRDSLKSAWKRFRSLDAKLPELQSYFHVESSTSPCAFVVPKGAEAPPPVIDGQVTDKGPLPKFVISDGDLHYPVHDPYVEAAKLAFARDIKPQVWVNVGDVWDHYHLSRFDKSASKMLDPGTLLQSEFDAAQPYLKEVCRIADRMHIILGNHENRLSKLINANLGLFNLRALDWKRIAELPANANVIPYGKRLRIGAVTWQHGDQLGGRFGVLHPEYWLLVNKGDRNTIFGHTHRIGARFKTVWDENLTPHTYAAFNQGHGSDAKKAWDWCPESNWAHGFCLVEHFTVAGKPHFTVHQIAVVDGKFAFNGKIYDGRKCQ